MNGLYVTLYDTAAGQAGVWTLLFQSEDEVSVDLVWRAHLTHLTHLGCGLLQVRQYALATALAKYGAMAGPGQIGPSVLTVDVHVGTGSELVRTQPAPLAAQARSRHWRGQSAFPGDQLGVTYTGWLRDQRDPLKPGKVRKHARWMCPTTTD